MVTPEKLAEWKRLADAAAPGPWYVFSDETCGPRARLGVWNALQDARGNQTLIMWRRRGTGGGHKYGYPSAEFIAEARTAVPALIADVERLRAERDEAQAVSHKAWPLFEECRRLRALLANVCDEAGDMSARIHGEWCGPECDGPAECMPEAVTAARAVLARKP